MSAPTLKTAPLAAGVESANAGGSAAVVTAIVALLAHWFPAQFGSIEVQGPLIVLGTMLGTFVSKLFRKSYSNQAVVASGGQVDIGKV